MIKPLTDEKIKQALTKANRESQLYDTLTHTPLPEKQVEIDSRLNVMRQIVEKLTTHREVSRIGQGSFIEHILIALQAELAELEKENEHNR